MSLGGLIQSYASGHQIIVGCGVIGGQGSGGGMFGLLLKRNSMAQSEGDGAVVFHDQVGC